MQDLQDKVAVVTGAASGIGLALTKAFLAEGMKVVMADIETEALQQAAAAVSGDVLAVVTDVGREASVSTLAERAFSHYGAVHILCNNAGVSGAGGPSWTLTPNDWKWILGVNLWGVIHGIRAFVPRMIEQGAEAHIVNTASTAGLLGFALASAYCATKHAVIAISESLQLEIESLGIPIGVSVLCPSAVSTRITSADRNRPADLKNSGPADPEMAKIGQLIKAAIAAGKAPEEIAARTIEAIRKNQFYIFTHEGDTARIQAWYDRVAKAENPQPVRWDA